MESKDPLRKVLERKGSTVFTVGPRDTVFGALEVLARHNIGAVPVVDGGRLVGMLSERDYARKLALAGKDSRQTPVAEVMSQPVLTVPPDLSVDVALALMSEKHLRHLPVLDRGALAGLVSIGDLVSWTLSAQAETIESLHRYIAGQYPG